MSKPKQKKDDAYFKAIQDFSSLLTKDVTDDAAHAEVDSKIAELSRKHGLSYTAVLKNVLERVRLTQAGLKKSRPKLKQ